MTPPPFPGNDLFDQIDSVARNLTGNAFRLKRDDPDAPQKFTEFVAQSEQEFNATQPIPQAAQPTQTFQDFEQGGFQINPAGDRRAEILARQQAQADAAGPSLFDRTLGRGIGALGRAHLEAFEELSPVFDVGGALGAMARPHIPGIQETEFDRQFAEARAREQVEGTNPFARTLNARAFREALPSASDFTLIGDPRGASNPILGLARAVSQEGYDPLWELNLAELGAAAADPLNILPVTGTTAPLRAGGRVVTGAGKKALSAADEAAAAIGRTGVGNVLDPVPLQTVAGRVEDVGAAKPKLIAFNEELTKRLETEPLQKFDDQFPRAREDRVSTKLGRELTPEVSAAQTGEPFDAVLFRGFGREDARSVFNDLNIEGNVLGEGTYTTPSAIHAANFGDEIEELRVVLQNPLVIRTDTEWRQLTRDAGLKFPKGFEEGRAAQIRTHIEALGHDGVIVQTGDDLINDVFGTSDTVLDFSGVRPDVTAARGIPEDAAAAARGAGVAGRQGTDAIRQHTRDLIEQGGPSDEFSFHVSGDIEGVINRGLRAGGLAGSPLQEQGYGEVIHVFRNSDLPSGDLGADISFGRGFDPQNPPKPVETFTWRELGVDPDELGIGARAEDEGIFREPSAREMLDDEGFAKYQQESAAIDRKRVERISAAYGRAQAPPTPPTGTAAARQVTPQQQAIIDDVGTGARPADDAARLTPEQQLEADVAALRGGSGGGAAPPDVQVAPLPEGTVPDLTDFGELYDLTFREGKFGFKIPIIGKNITLPKFTPRKVGQFLRLGKADPSLKAQRIGQRIGHILNPLKDEGRNLVERALSYVNEIGTREGLFGKLDEFGRFTDDTAGVLKGKTLNDAERPAILRQLNPKQREYVDRLRQLSNAARELRVRAGADVGKISETEDLLFFSRGIVAKYNEAGDIIAIREIPDVGTSGRNIGGKASKARDVETMEELTEGGFTVVPYDQRVRDQLRAAYNANAEDALVKYVKENFDTVPAGSTFEDATKLPFQNHNILIRGREGQQIASDLTEALANQAKTEVGEGLSSFAKLNSVSRYFALAGDASVFGIQLIISAFGHKKAYVKALAAFADGLAKGIVSPELATKSNAARIQRSRELANRHSTLKLGGGEFTEAFNPEGVLGATDLWNEALSVRGAAQRLKAFPRRLLEPFRIATEAAFDEAGLSMAEGLESLAKNADGTFDTAALKDIDDYINNTRGLMSSSRIGVTQATRTRESAILLASQYRRAIGAFYSSMLQGGIKGDLARKSMFKMITGMMMLGAGITILKGVEDGDSPQKISQAVKERLNPLHPRYLLWEVAGQLVGPGSKILSDVRLLSKMANDPEGFMETKEWGSNNFVNWIRGQLAFSPGLPIDLLLGKDAGGNPMGEGWGLLANIITGNFIPLTANAAFFSGGPLDTSQGKAARGMSDFVGGRSFPAGAFDYLNNASDLTWGMKYQDTEPYQKRETRRSQAAMLDPITEERAAGGDKVSTYYSKAKKIDDTRLRQEKNIIDGLAGRGPLAGIVTKKPFPKAPQRNALDLYYEAQSNARNQKVGLAAGAGMDFDENKEEETDANIDALEAYNLTFDNAIVGDFFMPDVWNKLVSKLLVSLPQEQKEYVRRNTNQGVHAPGIMELLEGSATAKRILESQAARVAHSGKREVATLGIREPQPLPLQGREALPTVLPAYNSPAYSNINGR